MIDIFNNFPNTIVELDISQTNANIVYDYLRLGGGRDANSFFVEDAKTYSITMGQIVSVMKNIISIASAVKEEMIKDIKPITKEDLYVLISNSMFDDTYKNKIIDDVCIQGGDINSIRTYDEYKITFTIDYTI